MLQRSPVDHHRQRRGGRRPRSRPLHTAHSAAPPISTTKSSRSAPVCSAAGIRRQARRLFGSGEQSRHRLQHAGHAEQARDRRAPPAARSARGAAPRRGAAGRPRTRRRRPPAAPRGRTPCPAPAPSSSSASLRTTGGRTACGRRTRPAGTGARSPPSACTVRRRLRSPSPRAASTTTTAPRYSVCSLKKLRPQ